MTQTLTSLLDAPCLEGKPRCFVQFLERLSGSRHDTVHPPSKENPEQLIAKSPSNLMGEGLPSRFNLVILEEVKCEKANLIQSGPSATSLGSMW
jgi:hypothetical protein